MSRVVITGLGDEAGDPEGKVGCRGHRERWRSTRSEVALVRTRNEKPRKWPSIGEQVNSNEDVDIHTPTYIKYFAEIHNITLVKKKTKKLNVRGVCTRTHKHTDNMFVRVQKKVWVDTRLYQTTTGVTSGQWDWGGGVCERRGIFAFV